MRKFGFLLVTLLTVSACSTGAADLPLPGSSLSGPSYEVTAKIDDALNLAVGAPIKLNGVTVGRVTSVTAHDFTARIAMSIRTSSRLHEGASMRLRATTPLGELFVDVTDNAEGVLLADGAAIDAQDVSAAPTVEDTLASASLLVNGGGLGQLQTIAREANNALGGREATARELLETLNRTMRNFNDSSADIDATLDALADVSEVLNDRETTINRALIDVAPAARVLAENTDELSRLLQAVDQLSGTTTRVVRETRADLLTILRELGPVLDEVVGLNDELGPGLDALVALAEAIDKGVPGDYLNVYLRFQGEASIGVPNLPVVGDPGVGPVEIGGSVLENLPLPGSLQDQLIQGVGPKNDTGLSGLLGRIGGAR